MNKIQDATTEDMVTLLPAVELERHIEALFGKRELKHFRQFMNGQTVTMIETQAGVNVADIMRYLRYRKRRLKGQEMPLVD